MSNFMYPMLTIMKKSILLNMKTFTDFLLALLYYTTYMNI